MNVRVLVVDDEEAIRSTMKQAIDYAGHDCLLARSGQEGLDVVERESPDVVFLDIKMPGMDGLEVLREIRRESEVPVLMLTGRGEEADRVMGLELGADDYLPKTFSTRELLARLRAVTRRSSRKEGDVSEGIEELVNGELRMRPEARTASLGEAALTLTALEFDLLYSLAQHAGRVRSREQLLDDVAGRNYDVFDRSIDVHMSSLRRKLDDNPRDARYIKTIRSVGYMMMKH